jgi:hypothetical protein
MKAPAAALAMSFLVAAHAAADVNVGDVIQRELRVGGAGIRQAIPLPAGEWQVLRVKNFDGRRTSPDQQMKLPRFVDVVLAQRQGAELAMMMRVVTLREPIEITRWGLEPEPCVASDALHLNAYDSSPWNTKCLIVRHVPGFLTTASSEYSDVRQWIAAQSVGIPSTALYSLFTRFAPYQNLRVYVWVNPGLRNFDSPERSRTANPFHPDWLAKDPPRKQYVDEFVAWSETYMKQLVTDAGASRKEELKMFR